MAPAAPLVHVGAGHLSHGPALLYQGKDVSFALHHELAKAGKEASESMKRKTPTSEESQQLEVGTLAKLTTPSLSDCY